MEETKDKILEVLKKIIQNKNYKGETYPKIILKCPANKSGENKMEKAFWNVYFVLSNYFSKDFNKTDDDYEEYRVTFTENVAYDMPSDYLDLDKLDVFYVDVANALDVDGEYIIGCSGFYATIEETDNILKMSSKNSLIIDVDEFNNICDDLYVNVLYHSTIDKLFTTDSYEYSFAADAKIVKAVCKAVGNYIDSLSCCNPVHSSHIKTDEIESLEDDYNVKVTFYVEEESIDDFSIVKFYAKFKKYSIADILKDEVNTTDEFKKEGNNNMENKNINNNGAEKDTVAAAPANTAMLPEIEKIYYNKTKKTVNIYWANGTETKAVTAEGDKFSLTTGIKECFIKYACGNNFDSVQKKLQDAKKKAVLTVSKEKPKKTAVERLAAEASNLTYDEKNELVKVLTEAKNAEVKPAKKVPAKRPKRKADEIGGNN